MPNYKKSSLEHPQLAQGALEHRARLGGGYDSSLVCGVLDAHRDGDGPAALLPRGDEPEKMG